MSSLDRAALERVLARAAELQAASSDPGDASEAMTEAQLIELGKEVGLSAEHLRQAMAEERMRVVLPPDETGLAVSLIGISGVRAARTVVGRPADTLGMVDAWMQREEGMMVKRHLGDRIVWEPRRDWVWSVRRALNMGGRGYALTRASEVVGTVTAVDDRQVLVSVEASLAENRARLAWESTGATLAGLGGAGALAVMGVMIPVAVVPAVIVPTLGLYLARRAQARAAARAQLALEQMLDRLGRGDLPRPATLIGALAAAAAAVIPPPRKP